MPIVQPNSAMLLLPRAAYLVALDSALVHIGRDAPRVWVDGPEPFPFGDADLAGRRARRGDGDATCPGEASVKFQVPRRRTDGTIQLRVIEETSVPPGWSFEYSYDFECTKGACKLTTAGQLPGDLIRTCRRAGKAGT